LLQDGHALNALLSLDLIWILLRFLLLHCVHVHLAEMLRLVQVLIESIWRVNWLICLGAIFTSVLQDDLLATRMLRHELSDIICATVNDDPARVCVVVLRDLLAGELHLLRVVAIAVHCGKRRMA